MLTNTYFIVLSMPVLSTISEAVNPSKEPHRKQEMNN